MRSAINLSPCLDLFEERIASAEQLLSPNLYSDSVLSVLPGFETQSAPAAMRGLSVVVLYAAYEALLRAICSTLNESVNVRHYCFGDVHVGIRALGSRPHFEGLGAIGPNRMWARMHEYLSACDGRQIVSIPGGQFPDDGSHMRQEQLKTIARVYGLSDPAPKLRRVHTELNSVVDQRNQVAHGSIPPSDIGRLYSQESIEKKVLSWKTRFTEWVRTVEVEVNHSTWPLATGPSAQYALRSP